MDRLHTQLRRLYHMANASAEPSHGMLGADGRVRALVLALRGPADWRALSPVWHGVQAQWAWPAPAIAVNGVDAFELWFSLAQPVPLDEAAAQLRDLCRRFLPDVRPDRLRLWPSREAATWAAPSIPALLAPERWSAFVTADLAAVFGDDDPWLDVCPGDDAQAELLGRLSSIGPADWQNAVTQRQVEDGSSDPVASSALAMQVPPDEAAVAALSGPYQNPRHFLRDVMNNGAVALPLRIEAAKALLTSGGGID